MSDPVSSAEVYLQVVRARGFTAAAKVLGRDASSLSRTVAELERALGAQLIVRTTRRLHLTEAGALYVQHAETLLAAHRSAKDAITELVGGDPRGHLRVSMPVSVGERLLAPALPAFQKQFPELHLQIDLSDRNVPLVEGGFDLALRVGRPPDSSLRAQLLARVPVLLVASPAYVKKHGTPRKPGEIPQYAAVTVGGVAATTEWVFHRQGQRERVTVNGVVHTTSPTLASRLAVAGVGLLRTTEWIIRDELAKGQLVEVMPLWRCQRAPLSGVPVYVMYAQGATASPPLKARVFVEFIKRVIARDVLKVEST